MQKVQQTSPARLRRRPAVLRVLVLFLMSAAAAWAEEPADQARYPVIREIHIEAAGDPAGREALAADARRLITLKSGDRLGDGELADLITHLRDSGLFSAIEIPDPAPLDGGVRLLIQVAPARRIRDVRISGAFPLLEREVLNRLSLYPGDRYAPEKMEADRPEMEQKIRELYAREGFSHARVDIRTIPAREILPQIVAPDAADSDSDDAGDRIILVEIDRGKPTSLRTVYLSGNVSFSSARLLPRLDTWYASILPGEGGRLVEAEVKKDTKSLVEFYRSRDYPDVKIRSEIMKLPDGSAEVLFEIDEGPEYDIEFEGNEEFWSFFLSDELEPLEKGGNAGGLGMKRSLRNIRKRYKTAGYPEARITVEEVDAGRVDGEVAEKEEAALIRRLRIRIKEEERLLVNAVRFSGHTAFSGKELKAQMLTRPPGLLHDGAFVKEELEKDLEALASLYRADGYQDVEISYKTADAKTEDPPEMDDDGDNEHLLDVDILIREGVRVLVDTVAITGLTALSEKAALEDLLLRPGEPFRRSALKADEKTLAERIGETGRPHVRVKSHVDRAPGTGAADIRFEVTEGPEVRMGELLIKGAFRTREKIIRREFDMHPGDPFSLREFLRAQQAVRNIQALQSVRFRALGLKEEADTVHLLAYVEERKPWYVEFGGGYDSEREFFVHGTAGDRNFMGRNIHVWAGGDYSGIGYRAETGLQDPCIFGSRISAGALAYAEERELLNQNFGRKSMGAGIYFQREIFPELTAGLRFGYEYREQYRTTDEPVPEGDEWLYDPRSIFMVSPSLEYRSTDSLIRPTKGIRARLSTDISTGLDNDLDDFLRYRLDLRAYRKLSDRLVLALRGCGGYIDPLSSGGRVAEDQLFFLGGTSTVRGFRENALRYDADDDPLGGQTEWMASAELRWDTGLSMELILFTDGGTVRTNPDAAGGESGEDFRMSAGLGIGYQTPIGPLGLFYGHKLVRKEGESPGRVHFSIGYTF